MRNEQKTTDQKTTDKEEAPIENKKAVLKAVSVDRYQTEEKTQKAQDAQQERVITTEKFIATFKRIKRENQGLLAKIEELTSTLETQQEENKKLNKRSSLQEEGLKAYEESYDAIEQELKESRLKIANSEQLEKNT